MLSLYGLVIQPDKLHDVAHFNMPKLQSLGLTGAILSLESTENLFVNFQALLFIQVSKYILEKEAFRSLASDYDVSITFMYVLLIKLQ